jgi:hypothetical protein
LIKLPQLLVNDRQQLHKENPQFFRKSNLIDVETSVDALAPDSPILPVMLNARRAPWVKYHNIIGLIPDKGLVGRVVGGSDGVVSFASAHLDNVNSEIVVENADHLTVNRHPLSVLEVHRILLEHLTDIDGPPPSRLERMPMTASANNRSWGPIPAPQSPTGPGAGFSSGNPALGNPSVMETAPPLP